MQFSVILNTYNRPEFLNLVLHAYRLQTVKEFEIVIADDGSDERTREIVEQVGRDGYFPICHVWHERTTHRRAEILNKAVQAARHPVLLFSDCDSLPLHDLLETHARYFDPSRMLVGGYIRLDEAYTRTITLKSVLRGEYEKQVTAQHRKALRRMHLRNCFYILIRKKNRPHNMGLNFSLSRANYYRVNGYDNNFRGWGKADGDLRERLKSVGVWPKSVWDKALICHLFHPNDPTKKLKMNKAYSQRDKIPVVAENGIAQVRCSPIYDSRLSLSTLRSEKRVRSRIEKR
jgi:glycosyltransferase involved in cell wall biosynthesis